MIRVFEIEGQVLGMGESGITHNHHEPVLPPSYAFLCPHCGRTWARVRTGERLFFAQHIPCRECPEYAGFIPGSVWLEWSPEYLASLPPLVVQRELMLHLNWKEKQ